jgi:hypothetical protein
VKKSTVAGLAGASVLALAIVFSLRPATDRMTSPGVREQNAKPGDSRPRRESAPANELMLPRPAPPPPAAHALSPEEKAARVEKIKRDYDEIRSKASADYSAAGAAFPGGLNAFLRQLALLEREKRADLTAVLTTSELEDLELRDTNAGQLVHRLLDDTAATDEQRRAVFRLQRAFEDRFALTFDLTPRALLERETARQQAQEQIHGVLGDTLFGAWLRGEGPEFQQLSTFLTQQGLPSSSALDVWRVKNEFTLRRLELTATNTPAADQRAAQAALTLQTEARLMAIVGQAGLQAGRADMFGWLPKK